MKRRSRASVLSRSSRDRWWSYNLAPRKGGAREDHYCPACLIAQDTATVTWSVSSPCATGAAAAMPAAILRNVIGTGVPPFRDAERRAERDAGGLGVNFGLAAGIGGRPVAGGLGQV